MPTGGQPAPPVFEQIFRNARFAQGGNALFEGKVRGNPRPTISWTRQGRPINDSNKYQLKYNPTTGEVSLMISRIGPGDEGEYTCLAKNQYGEAICTVYIQPEAAYLQQQQQQQQQQQGMQRRMMGQQQSMQFRQEMSSVTDSAGHTTTSSTVDRQYQSSPFGQQYPGLPAGQQTEEFRVDTFEYRLIRETEFRESLTRRYAGETETETEVETESESRQPGPLSPPQVQTKPRATKVAQGGDATFQARLVGNPKPKVTWFRNGVRVRPGPRAAMAHGNSMATLKLRAVQPEDSAHYTMLAENAAGCVVSSAFLAVEPPAAADAMRQAVTSQRVEKSFTSQTEEISEDRSLAPTFLRVPTDKETQEGKMVRLECRTSGKPSPEVFWYINGMPITNDATHKIMVNEAGSHALMITNAAQRDSGVVTCVAKNKNGQAEFQVNLHVLEKEQVIAPKFVERFQTVHVRPGEPVSMSCRAVGAPTPRITWQKDGAPIDGSASVRIVTDGGASMLDIPCVRPEDAAWYQCTAQNAAGSTATRAKLYVEAGPAVPAGEPWRLHLPKPTKVIEPEPPLNPEIIHLKHVERSRPKAQRTEEERPLQAPQFTHPLRDVRVGEGDRVLLEAKVVPLGDPTMTIGWFIDGQPMPASSRATLTDKFGYVSLSLLSVVQQDAGTYTCRAVNQAGSADSTCTVSVGPRSVIETTSQHPESLQPIQMLEDTSRYVRSTSTEEHNVKPSFVRELRDVAGVHEGGYAHFEAQIQPVSDPYMRIEWFKDGRSITASSRISTINNFGYLALNINQLRPEDSGVYTARATNKAGEASSQAQLQVSLRAGVTGDLGIPEQQKHIQSVEQLEAYKQSIQQQVTSELEEKTSPPQFTQPIRDAPAVPENGTAHFEARLEPMGDATMTIRWLKDGRPLEASSRMTTFFNFGYVSLTIKQVTVFDTGVYTCVAVNAAGQAQCQAKLQCVGKKDVVTDGQMESMQKIQYLEDSSRSPRQVEEDVTVTKMPPKFLGPIKGTNVIREGQKAHFEARLEPQNDPTMKTEWFHNGQPLSSANRIQTFLNFGYVALDISAVKSEDAGTYTLVATNALGEARAQAQMKVEAKSAIDTSSIHRTVVAKTDRLERSKFQEPQYDVGDYCKSKPKFTEPLRDQPAQPEGRGVHLECRLEPVNDPTMKVEWFQNGRPITIGSRFRTYAEFGFVALDVLDLTKADEGEYTCRATNRLGSAHTSAAVRVLSRADVDTDTQHESALDQIQYLEDGSRYSRQAAADAAVEQVPTFTKPLRNIETVEGTNVHLECRLQPVGDNSMKVEWFVNDQPLKIGHRFRPAYDFDYVALDLLSVYPIDSGMYTCRATNRLGQAATSASVRVIAKKDLYTDHPASLERIQYIEDSSRYQRKEWADEMVQIKPKFLTQLKHQENLKENQTAHFEAKLEPVADANLHVEWLKDGKPITVGHRHRPLHDFGYVALDIVGLIEEDNGVYTCRATNNLGFDETSAILRCSSSTKILTSTQHEVGLEQVQQLEERSRHSRSETSGEVTTQAPVFTTSLSNVTIKEGQRAHFESRLIPVSDPTMNVQWFHNGRPVKAGSRFMETNNFGFVALDIMYAYPEDQGTYTCKATNALGEAVTQATLSCLSKSAIDQGTLHEQALDKLRYLEQKSRPTPAADEATAQAPVFTQPIRDARLAEGQPLHFEARLIPVGDANLRVEWFKNGVPLQQANRISTLHDFGFVALDMKYTQEDDSGTYTCRATNDLGQAVTSATAVVQSKESLLLGTQNAASLEKLRQLEGRAFTKTEIEETVVTEKPRFVTELTGQTSLVEGQSAHMEARIEPYPDADMKVEWFHNGKAVAVGHRYRTINDFGFIALDVLSAYPEDSGEYTAKITNRLGTASSSLNLRVQPRAALIQETQHPAAMRKISYLESERRREEPEEAGPCEKPVFGRPLRNANLVEGQSAHLEATLTPVHDATMKVEWFYNGRPIPQGHRFRTTYDFGYVALDILYTYPEDSGTYMCKATNAAGEAVTTCDVTVEGKPVTMPVWKSVRTTVDSIEGRCRDGEGERPTKGGGERAAPEGRVLSGVEQAARTVTEQHDRDVTKQVANDVAEESTSSLTNAFSASSANQQRPDTTDGVHYPFYTAECTYVERGKVPLEKPAELFETKTKVDDLSTIKSSNVRSDTDFFTSTWDDQPFPIPVAFNIRDLSLEQFKRMNEFFSSSSSITNPDYFDKKDTKHSEADSKSWKEGNTEYRSSTTKMEMSSSTISRKTTVVNGPGDQPPQPYPAQPATTSRSSSQTREATSSSLSTQKEIRESSEHAPGPVTRPVDTHDVQRDTSKQMSTTRVHDISSEMRTVKTDLDKPDNISRPTGVSAVIPVQIEHQPAVAPQDRTTKTESRYESKFTSITKSHEAPSPADHVPAQPVETAKPPASWKPVEYPSPHVVTDARDYTSTSTSTKTTSETKSEPSPIPRPIQAPEEAPAKTESKQTFMRTFRSTATTDEKPDVPTPIEKHKALPAQKPVKKIKQKPVEKVPLQSPEEVPWTAEHRKPRPKKHEVKLHAPAIPVTQPVSEVPIMSASPKPFTPLQKPDVPADQRDTNTSETTKWSIRDVHKPVVFQPLSPKPSEVLDLPTSDTMETSVRKTTATKEVKTESETKPLYPPAPVMPDIPVASQTEQQKRMEEKFFKKVVEHQESKELPEVPAPTPAPVYDAPRPVVGPQPQLKESPVISPAQAPKAPRTEQQKRMEETFRKKVIQNQESKELPEAPVPVPAPIYEAPPPAEQPAPQPKESPVVRDFRDSKHWEVKTFQTTKEAVAPVEASPVPSQTEQQKKMEQKFFKHLRETEERVPEAPAEVPAPEPTPPELRDIREFHSQQTHQTKTIITRTQEPTPVPEPIQPAYVEPVQAPEGPRTMKQEHRKQTFTKVTRHEESEEQPEKIEPKPAPIYDAPRPFVRPPSQPQESPTIRDFHDSTHKEFKTHKTTKETVVPVEAPVSVPSQTEQQRKMERKFLKQLQETEDRIPVSPVPEPVTKDVPDVHEYHAQQICKSKTITTTTQEPIPLPEPVKPVWVEPVQTPKAPQTLQQKRMEEKFVKKVIEHQESKELPDSVERTPAPIYDTPRPSARPLPQPKDSPVIQDFRESEHQQFKTFASTKETVAPAETPAPVPSQTMQQKVSELKLLKQVQEKDSFPDVPAPKPAPEPSPQEPQTVHELRTQHVQQSRTITTTTIQQPTPLPEPMKPVWVEPVEAPKAPQTEQQKRMEEKFMKKVIEHQESKELPEVPAPMPAPLYEAPRPVERSAPQPSEFPVVQDFHDFTHREFKSYTTSKETVVPTEAPAPVPSAIEQQKKMERKVLKQVQQTDEKVSETPAPAPAPKPAPPDTHDVREFHTQQTRQHKTITTTTQPTPSPEAVKPVEVPKAPQTEQRKRLEEQFLKKVIKHQESKELPEVPAPVPAPVHEAPRPAERPAPQPKTQPKETSKVESHFQHRYETSTTTQPTPKLPTGPSPTQPARVKPAEAPQKPQTEQQKRMEETFMKKVTKQQEFTHVPKQPDTTSVREEKDQKSRIRERERKPSLPESASDISDSDASLRIREIETKPLQADKYESYTSKVFIGPRVQEPPIYHKIVLEEDEKKKKKENIYETVIPFPSHFTPGPVSEAPQPAPVRKPSPSLVETVVKHVPAPKPAKKILPKTTHTVARPPASPPSAPMFTDKVPEPRHVDTKPAEAPKPAEVSKTPTKDKVQFTPTKFVPSHAEPTPVPVPEQETESPLTGLKHVESPKTARKPVPKAPAVPFPFENGDVPKTKPVSFAVPSIPKKETQVPIVEKIPRKVFSKPKSKDIPKPTQPVKHDMPSPKPAQVGPTQPDSKASSVQKWVTEVERATKDIKAQESPAPKAPQTEQQKRMEEKFMKKVIERQESKELPEVPAPKPVPLYEAPRPAERPVPQPKESPAIHDFRDSKHETFKTCTTTRETAVPVEAPAPVPSQTEQQKVMERKFLKQVQETETTHEAPAPLPAPKPMPQEVRDVRELHTQQIHQSKTVTTTTHEQTPLPEQVKPAWVEPVQAPKAPQTEQQKRMEEKFMTKVIQHQESKELPEVPAPMPAPLYEAPRPVQPPVPQPKESPVVHDFRDTTHHEFKTFTTTKETVAPTEAPAPVPSHTEQQKKMELKFLKKVQETEKIPEGPAQTPAPKPTPREVHDVQEFRTHQTQQSQTTTTKTHVPSPVPEPIKPVWVEPAQAPKAPQTEQQRRLEEKFMKKVIERQESKELPEVPVPMSAPVYDSPRPVERAVPAPKISKPLHTRPKLQKPAQPIPVSVPIAVPTEPLITPLVPQKATWQESIPSKPFQPVTAPRQTPRKDETVLKKYDDIAKTTRQTTREEEKRVFSPAPLPDHPALPQTTEITQSKLFASRTETVHVPEAPKSLPVPKKPAAPVPEKPTSGVRSTLERIEKQIKEDVVTQQPLPVITQPIQPKQTERTSQKFEGTMSSQSSSTWQTSSHVTGPEARPAPAPILPLTQPKHAVRQTVDESRRHELTQQKITSQPRPLGEDHPVVIRPQSEAPRPRQERTEQTETSRVFSEQTVTSSGRPDTAPVTRPERPLRQVPSMPHKMEVLPKAPETLQPYVDRHETFSSSRTSEKTDTGHKQTETAEKKGHEVQHSVTKTPTSRATRTVEQMSYQTMSQSVETSERGVPAVPAPKVIEMRPLEAPAPQRTTIEQTKSWQEMVDKVEKAASLEDQIVKQAPHKPVATPPSQRGWTTIEDKHQTEQITKKRSHGEQIIPIEMPPVSGKVSPLPSKLSQEQKEQLSESRHEVWQDVPSSPFSTPSVCRETTQKQSSRFEERKTDSSHVLNSRERIIPVAGAPQSSAPAPVHQSPLPASKRKEQQTVGQSFNTFEQTIQQPSSAPRETIVPVQLTSQNLQKHTESFSTRSSSSKLQEPLSTPRQDSPSQPVAPQDIPWPDEQIQRPTHVQPQQAPAPKPRAPPAQQRTETTSREERFQKSTSSSSSGPEHVIPVAVAPQADRAHAGKQSQTVSRQSLFEKSVTSSEDEHVIPAAVSPAFAPRQNATQSETRQSHFERSVTSGREHVVPMAIVPSAASPHPGEQTQMTSRQSLIDKSTSSSGQEHVVPTALATPTAAAPYADRQETSSHSKSRQSAGNQVTETETSERSSYSVHHSGSVPVTSQGRPGVTQRSTETRQEMHQSKSEHTGSQQQQAAPPRQVPAKTTSEKRQVMYETKTESASNKWGSQPGTPGCSDAGSDRRSLADSVKSWGSNKETTETNRRESTETGRGQVTKWGAGLFDGGRDMVSTAPRKEKSFVEQWDKDGKNERYQSMGYTSGSDFEQFEENGRSVQKAKEGKEAKKTDKKKEFSETEEMRPDGKYRIQKTVETRTEEEMTQSKQSETTRETLPEICR